MGKEVFGQLGGDPKPNLRHATGVLRLHSYSMFCLGMPVLVNQPSEVGRPIVSLHIREANCTLAFREMVKLETGFLMGPHKFPKKGILV